MSTQTRTVLTCNGCQSEAPRRFDASFDPAITPWMNANGWQHVGGRDLCPACLMDADAEARTS